MPRMSNAGRTCSSPGCEAPSQSKGMCRRHYRRAFPTSAPIRQCTYPGCTDHSRELRKGFCPAHYNQQWRGHPLRARTEDARFHERVASIDRNGPPHPILGTPCWIWTGTINNKGYGKAGNHEYVHRRWYALINGAIPDGLEALHKCDNPPCFNPDHIFLGTHQDNMDDMTRKGRAMRGIRKGMKKLSQEESQAIRDEYSTSRTITVRVLSEKYGVGRHQIRGALGLLP